MAMTEPMNVTGGEEARLGDNESLHAGLSPLDKPPGSDVRKVTCQLRLQMASGEWGNERSRLLWRVWRMTQKQKH